MIKSVIQDPNPVLHKKTKLVEKSEIFSDKITGLIRDMKDTLEEQDGLGLAAPQINVSLSVFVIPEHVVPKIRTPLLPLTLIKPLRPTVFINPEITYYSKEKEILEEGCLSIRGIFSKTPRASMIKLKALDDRGRKIYIRAEGLLARIFQHEVDHLNGILFIERL